MRIRWYNPVLGDFEWRVAPETDEEALALMEGSAEPQVCIDAYREWRKLGRPSSRPLSARVRRRGMLLVRATKAVDTFARRACCRACGTGAPSLTHEPSRALRLREARLRIGRSVAAKCLLPSPRCCSSRSDVRDRSYGQKYNKQSCSGGGGYGEKVREAGSCRVHKRAARQVGEHLTGAQAEEVQGEHAA